MIGFLTLPHLATFPYADPAQYRGAIDRSNALSLLALWNEAAASSPPMKHRSTTSGVCAVQNFGLANLFGVSFDGRLEGPMRNSYLTLHKDPATGKFHPLLSGFEDATRIINGVNRVVVKPAMPRALFSPHCGSLLPGPARWKKSFRVQSRSLRLASSFARWGEAAWFTSRATWIALFGTCWQLTMES